MNLYDKFCNRDFFRECIYYERAVVENPMEQLSNESCFRFISQIFEYGSKSSVFEVDFKEDFEVNGIHIHTAALYFLGCLLKEILPNKDKALIDMFDFKYSWFLSCLYHDTVSVIEKESLLADHDNRFKQLDFYLGKYNVKYNVFHNKAVKKEPLQFTYSEYLVNNYFFYRTDYWKSIDHGILGGYILFDRLVKNYNKAWEEYKKKNNNPSGGNYYHFTYKELSWKIEHIDHFAMIADSIIAHNMWVGNNENKSIYRKYGLDELIKSDKINNNNKPLVFFLSLLDTIEPTKRFKNSEPIDVLKSIHVTYHKHQKEIRIKVQGQAIDKDDYLSWFSYIKKSEEWLDIEVTLEDEALTVRIN